MDATAIARKLIEPVPVHRTFGLEVESAVDGVGRVAMTAATAFANVIGALHSSGLITLVDAAGLAAIIAAADDEAQLSGVLPLGTAATLEFRSPGRGRLTATCALDDEARSTLRTLLSGATDRASIRTDAEVVDEAGTVVCRGGFTWRVRRRVPPSA